MLEHGNSRQDIHPVQYVVAIIHKLSGQLKAGPGDTQ